MTVGGTTANYDPSNDVKLVKQKPKVSLEKFSDKKLSISTPEIVESDSEYETEKVYEFREWYPPGKKIRYLHIYLDLT